MMKHYCVAGPGESEEHCGEVIELHWTHSRPTPASSGFFINFMKIVMMNEFKLGHQNHPHTFNDLCKGQNMQKSFCKNTKDGRKTIIILVNFVTRVMPTHGWNNRKDKRTWREKLSQFDNNNNHTMPKPG